MPECTQCGRRYVHERCYYCKPIAPSTPAPWYLDSANIATLGRWMQENGELPDEEIWYFVGNPWKWTAEWEAFDEKNSGAIR